MTFHDDFQKICGELKAMYSDVDEGPMMTAPGLRKKGKVFAFYHMEDMTFRLGKGFDPSQLGIEEWDWLSPFKEKPPMKGWFIIPNKYNNKWPLLAEIAYKEL